jgi:putative transposase
MAGKMRKQYSAAFKAQIVQEVLKGEKTVSQISSEHGIHPTMISQWKSTAVTGLPTLFERSAKAADQQIEHERKIDELYKEIGRLSTQVSWLKKKSGLEPD